jgi:Ca-activated chloride channel homolog
MLNFRFHDPWWLLLLVVLAGIVYAWMQRRRATAIVYSDVSIVATLPRTFATVVREYLPWVAFAAAAFVIVALARPQQGKEDFRIKTEGIAIEMCLDRSGSMQAVDFELDGKRVDRLDAVKNVFTNFVEGKDELPGRPDDLIGLVTFGGFADAKCPLTLDHDALIDILKTVEVPKPVFDSQGRIINERLLQEESLTAIGDSLVLAVDRLQEAKAKSKIIILLSDGKSNAGVVDPVEAIEAAKTHGIKVYTIGVGTGGMVPFPVLDPRTGNTVLQMQQVEVDPATLAMLAKETGGHYFQARDTEGLEAIYAKIDELEKTASEKQVYTQYRELYRYFMLPGLALIFLQITLVSTRFRSIP